MNDFRKLVLQVNCYENDVCVRTEFFTGDTVQEIIKEYSSFRFSNSYPIYQSNLFESVALL